MKERGRRLDFLVCVAEGVLQVGAAEGERMVDVSGIWV